MIIKLHNKIPTGEKSIVKLKKDIFKIKLLD